MKVWLRETSSARCIAVVVNSLTCKVRRDNLERGVTWNAAHSSAPYSGTGTVRLTLLDGITLVHFLTVGCKSLTLSFVGSFAYVL